MRENSARIYSCQTDVILSDNANLIFKQTINVTLPMSDGKGAFFIVREILSCNS